MTIISDSTDPARKATACRVVRNIACSDDAVDPFIDQDALTLLSDLLYNEDDFNLLTDAAGAIRNMCDCTLGGLGRYGTLRRL